MFTQTSGSLEQPKHSFTETMAALFRVEDLLSIFVEDKHNWITQLKSGTEIEIYNNGTNEWRKAEVWKICTGLGVYCSYDQKEFEFIKSEEIAESAINLD